MMSIPTGSDTGNDEAEFAALTKKISRDKGFGCASYKEKCLRRRIAVRMRAKGVHTFGDYMRALDSDPREYERLLDALTINVTKLFRNPETYASIAQNVVPALWSLPSPQLRVWSAGCSSGEEPYSLAVLFHRHAESARALDRVGRVRIIGSDIDRDSLDAARRGTFDEAAFADTAPDVRTRYFGAPPSNPIRADVKALVQFERRDLLADPVPGTDFNLVTCRNVIIYFDRATQEALFQRFHSALLPGGFLVLGKVETLLGPARTMFAPVDSRERIFRRL